MTLNELDDWILAEYNRCSDEMEAETDKTEQARLEGVTDGLLHVLAYLQPYVMQELEE